MKSIPHDYYLKFTDSAVLAEVFDFHIKGNYVSHDAFNHMSYLHGINSVDLQALTGNELRLYPDMGSSIPLNVNASSSTLDRNESCDYFDGGEVLFSAVESLMVPLLGKSKNSYKRGYPSGGALYPVEVFVCSLNENSKSWPFTEKVIHLLPNAGEFEIVQNTFDSRGLKKSMLPIKSGIGTPPLAIVYVAYLPKTIFKYRYRGYRLALMEAGSIYMLVELQAKLLNLRCRLWSGFTDTMLCKSMGLNPAVFSPLCVHFIGGNQ